MFLLEMTQRTLREQDELSEVITRFVPHDFLTSPMVKMFIHGQTNVRPRG